MVGGTVKAIVHHKKSQCILVTNQWYRVDRTVPIEIGDELWTVDKVGYLNSKDGLYKDDRIEPCLKIKEQPERHWDGKKWIKLATDLF